MTPKQIETQIAAPLSAALITVAAISLLLIKAVPEPKTTYLDELLAAIGIMALIGAGRIIDNEFDYEELTFKARITLAGGGYPIFCVVVGLIAVSILVLDAEQGETYIAFLTWPLAIFTGTPISGLLMTKQGSFFRIGATATFYFLFLFATHVIHFCA